MKNAAIPKHWVMRRWLTNAPSEPQRFWNRWLEENSSPGRSCMTRLWSASPVEKKLIMAHKRRIEMQSNMIPTTKSIFSLCTTPLIPNTSANDFLFVSCFLAVFVFCLFCLRIVDWFSCFWNVWSGCRQLTVNAENILSIMSNANFTIAIWQCETYFKMQK